MQLIKKPVKYSFIFISQQGDLEIKSLLLAVSLKRKLKCGYELVAAIPSMYGGKMNPSGRVTHLLQKYGVRIEYFDNTYCVDTANKIVGDEYSNKAYSLGIDFKGEKVVFLDSDMLWIREFKGDNRFFSVDFNAKQVRYSHLKQWEPLYNLFGLKMPGARYPCDADGVYIPPYFNSGFFAVKKGLAKELGRKWIEIFRKVTETKILPTDILIRRNQVSLSIAVQMINMTYEVMGDTFNYPSGDKPLNIFSLPYAIHYHHPHKIYNIQLIKNLITSFIEEDKELKPILEGNNDWRIFLE